MSQAKLSNSYSKDQNFNTASDSMARNFHGAAIIDEHGHEIPITEEMIQKACKDLSNEWLFPRQARQH